MKPLKSKLNATINNIEHITNLLNQSTTKAAFSFARRERF